MRHPPRALAAAALVTLAISGVGGFARADSGPPRGNPYDVIGRVFQPFWSVLLAGGKDGGRAATLTLEMADVSGRLPPEMKGARLEAAVEFPDKVRLSAPVLGETVTVCRKGDEVWAIPGAKVEFLLGQFKVKPQPTRKKNTPIYLPVTPQQAVFLPALFAVERPEVAEVAELDGIEHRVITGGLMPELAKATRSEGFRAQLWVAPGHLPSRIIVSQPDFTADVRIRNLRFSPTLPPETWEPPAGATDIFRTHADMLDAVLFVVMNSLGLKEGSLPMPLPGQPSQPEG
ncbi:MAG: hypothetical protein N2322_02000 [Terrimicrobiaceae bacterium]|nr:hypothetical protein [Terrimicrobiaceae bacterium]